MSGCRVCGFRIRGSELGLKGLRLRLKLSSMLGFIRLGIQASEEKRWEPGGRRHRRKCRAIVGR